MTNSEIRSTVAGTLAATPVIDLHTHLFAPALGALGLWGIDELITYHYLEAELFRSSDIRPEQYWRHRRAERVRPADGGSRSEHGA